MKKKFVECQSTGTLLPESEATKVDDLFKTLPSGTEYHIKAMPVDYEFVHGERSEVSIITTSTRDKSSEVVLGEGLDLDTYRNSMVVLWMHQKHNPIGTCGWIKHRDGVVRAKTIYPTKPEDIDTTWQPDQVWAMTKCVPPILRCKSIGFIPRTPLRDPTSEELTEHPEWKGAGVWDDTMLLEFSVVHNGCNNEALIEMVNTKSVDPKSLEEMGIEVPPQVIETLPEIVQEVKEVQTKTGMPLDAAVAYVLKMPKRIKKKIDLDRIFAKAMNEVDLDVDAIVRKALAAHQNRGRV
jgi:hypothetical protein